MIVFVHGLGLNRHVWDSYLGRFSRRYRILNYDLFGHGESAPPPGMPSLAMFSGQLLELLDELAITPVWRVRPQPPADAPVDAPTAADEDRS